MAPKTAIGSGDFGPIGKVIFALIVAATFKVVVDEMTLVMERGFDAWRRHRFGW